MYEALLHQEGENIQEETVMMMMVLEGCTEIGDPTREGDSKSRWKTPLLRKIP